MTNLSDAHFRLFASNLEKAIERYEQPDDEDFLTRQKNQVESLVALEVEFRKTLVQHRWGPGVYRDFIHYICDERRNILAARPFFRERQGIFTKQISKALKKRAEFSLYRFHFNYQFILFVIAARPWKVAGGSKKLLNLFEEIKTRRTELVVLNMPLAISRAHIFYSRTPPSQLSKMDLIQISCEGLMSAIDKFVLPFSRVFRSVAIGRMVGNLISSYSETLVHFYPVDKRKIYRANKMVGKNVGVVDYQKVADSVNTGVGEAGHKTTSSEIADLLSAASCVSGDAEVASIGGRSEHTTVLTRYAAPEGSQPDVIVEREDLLKTLWQSMGVLSGVEYKVLRMKGIDVAALSKLAA